GWHGGTFGYDDLFPFLPLPLRSRHPRPLLLQIAKSRSRRHYHVAKPSFLREAAAVCPVVSPLRASAAYKRYSQRLSSSPLSANVRRRQSTHKRTIAVIRMQWAIYSKQET